MNSKTYISTIILFILILSSAAYGALSNAAAPQPTSTTSINLTSVKAAETTQIIKAEPVKMQPTLIEQPIPAVSEGVIQQTIVTDAVAKQETQTLQSQLEAASDRIDTTNMSEKLKEAVLDLRTARNQGRLPEAIRKLSEDDPKTYALLIEKIRPKDPALARMMLDLGNMTTEKLKSEVRLLRQEVRLKNLVLSKIPEEQLNNVMLARIDGKMSAVLPQRLAAEKATRFMMKDASGQDVAEIKAQFEEMTPQEAKAAATTAIKNVKRNIKRLELVSTEKEIKLKSLQNRLYRVKARIELNLNNINPESNLAIDTTDQLDELLQQRFEDLAKRNKMRFIDRGGVIQVEKTDLANKIDIQNASVVFKIQKEWLGNHSKKDVRIFRSDNDDIEMLPTIYMGEEEGLLVFKGESENGLSTFAVFMTETISDEGQGVNIEPKNIKAFLFPLMLIIIIGGALAGTYMMKRKD